MSRLVEGGILTVIFFLVINVLYLNIYLLSIKSQPVAASTNVEFLPNEHTPICDDICKEEISAKLLQKITPYTVSSETQRNNAYQEFIIPLGTGSSQSKEYQELPGVEAYIDTALYPKISKVIFETFVSIPTANGFAYIKLFNVTDKHDVWLSEQSMETNTITMRESTINIDNGRKLYRVMMKSTMGYEAKLHNARIRIITE